MIENIDTVSVARQLRTEYLKNWRKKNKDKVQKHNKTYWENKARKAMQAMQEVAN